MAGSSKLKCVSRIGEEEDATLCLCDLPDETLIHILSFLPTKSLVSTSLLAKRWRYMWTSTPNLQLDESQFRNDRDEFINFVERALLLRSRSSLVSFSLACYLKNDAYRIYSWIAWAIQKNVEQLSLNIRECDDSFFLPNCVFGCETLVKLDLQMMSSIKVPSMVCLPHLKHLALKSVEFADTESAEMLLSHPMLEELIISECSWCYVKIVNVNSPKLKSLSINNCIDDQSEERQVCFFGDNLKFFNYNGDLPPTQYCICGSTMQLKEADITVSIPDYMYQEMDGPSIRYCKLLNSLSMVQDLTLSDTTVHSFYQLSLCSWLETSFPVFERATQLNLHACDEIDIESVWLKMLYNMCPHLEHLNFMELIYVREGKPIMSPMPWCFRTHLKKITLHLYVREKENQDAINLLFNSAPLLEEVVIHWMRDSYITGHIFGAEGLKRELMRRPKVSKNCRVSVVLI